MQASHIANISITILLAAVAQLGGDFGTILMIWPKATNDLHGATVVEFTNTTDAATMVAAGGSDLSSAAYDAIVVAFSQNPRPASVKIGWVDLTTSVAAVKAFKAFATVGGGTFDTVIEAHNGGVIGNSIEVVLLPDSATTVSIEVLGATPNYTVIIHYKPATSTVSDVEAAITALSGANDIIDVKTAGTGATVLASGAAGEAMLAGGVDVVTLETYVTALARIAAYDDDFFGITIDSRTTAIVQAMVAAAEAMDRIFIAQSADTGLYASFPAGLSNFATSEHSALVYHDTATQYFDVALAAAALAIDPDEQSATWDVPVAGVTPYATGITDAQRLVAVETNHVNIAGPLGTEAMFVDPGTNGKGRPMADVVSMLWLKKSLQTEIANAKVALSSRKRKFPRNSAGTGLLVSAIERVNKRAVAAGHIDPGDPANDIAAPVIIGEPITTADKAAMRLRAMYNATFLGSARKFSLTVNLDT